MTSGSVLKDMPHFSQALCWAQPLDLPLPNRTDLGACLAPGLGRGQTGGGGGGCRLGEKVTPGQTPIKCDISVKG